MEEIFHHRDTCCLCATGKLEKLCSLASLSPTSPNVGRAAELGASRQSMLVPLDLYLCDACAHLQLADILNPEIQYREYRYRTSISLGLPEHFVTLAASLMQRTGFKAGARALEIGSNDGDRKSTRLNSSHTDISRMPSSA